MRDVWSGRFSFVLAAALAVNLPAGSRIWHALRHDLMWTQTDHLVAALIDRLRGSAEEKPFPRPGDLREQEEQARQREQRVAQARETARLVAERRAGKGRGE